MEIGGLQPVTLLDYPQKVAAIIFTLGCNMRCPFCYNPTLVVPELRQENRLIPEADVLEFMKKRRKYIDGVVISGGEPTLQPDLPAFLRKLKKLGYAVKLDTNGLRPEALEKLLSDGLVDYLAMDIKGPLENYQKFCGVAASVGTIAKSIALVMASGLPYEFRSTLAKGLHKPDDVEAMSAAIAGADQWYLQNFSRQDMLVDTGFSGKGFSRSELDKFVEIGSKKVKKCEIRLQ